MNLPASKTGKAPTTEIVYPNQRRALRQLSLAFPTADPFTVEELAFLVSARRHTIDAAIAILENEEQKVAPRVDKVPISISKPDTNAISSAKTCLAETVPHASLTHSQERPSPNHDTPNGRVTTTATATTATATTTRTATVIKGNDAHITSRTTSRGSLSTPNVQSPLEPRAASLASSKVLLFTTTMTGDRRVRDHCRQMETLLYLKRIPYEAMNVADDVGMQRKHREMYAAATGSGGRQPIPALFVGKHFIGDYEKLQELEDDGMLMETLLDNGLIFKDE